MKLCIIGNSHVAMVMRAWKLHPGEGLDLTFFARQGRGPEGIRLKGTEIRAVRPELRRALRRLDMPERLNLEAFDGFVLVGMTATVFAIGGMLLGHRIFGWPEADNEDPLPFLSEPSVRASLEAQIAGGLSYSVLQMIRQVTAAPVFVVPQPYPSEDVLQRPGKFGALKRIHQRGQGDKVAKILKDAHESAFARIDGLRILTQPEETVAERFLTHSEYMRGAGRLNVTGRQPDEDILHANEKYGARILGQLGRATR